MSERFWSKVHRQTLPGLANGSIGRRYGKSYRPRMPMGSLPPVAHSVPQSPPRCSLLAPT